MFTRLVPALIVSLGVPQAHCADSLTFWFNGDVSKLAGFQSIEDHPCGEVAYMKVDRLPPTDKGSVRSEKVIELDASGNVIRRWPMPVDFVPAAVHAKRILVEFGDRRYWVEQDGRFTRADGRSLPSGTHMQCKPHAEFNGSDYTQCEVFPDLGTKAPRILMYEGVCT